MVSVAVRLRFILNFRLRQTLVSEQSSSMLDTDDTVEQEEDEEDIVDAIEGVCDIVDMVEELELSSIAEHIPELLTCIITLALCCCGAITGVVAGVGISNFCFLTAGGLLQSKASSSVSEGCGVIRPPLDDDDEEAEDAGDLLISCCN